jgi:hypothetical protein
MAKDDKHARAVRLVGGLGGRLQRRFDVALPLTDEEIDERAWAILNILQGNTARRQAILKRAEELDEIIDGMARAKWARFAEHVDHYIEAFNIKGENKEDLLFEAFKIMRRIHPDLARYNDDTLKSRYYDGDKAWTKKFNKNNKVQK